MKALSQSQGSEWQYWTQSVARNNWSVILLLFQPLPSVANITNDSSIFISVQHESGAEAAKTNLLGSRPSDTSCFTESERHLLAKDLVIYISTTITDPSLGHRVF